MSCQLRCDSFVLIEPSHIDFPPLPGQMLVRESPLPLFIPDLPSRPLSGVSQLKNENQSIFYNLWPSVNLLQPTFRVPSSSFVNEIKPDAYLGPLTTQL